MSRRARSLSTPTSTTTGAISVTATRSGDLITISAGLAGAAGNDSISVAGSFSLNVIFNETEAYAGARRRRRSAATSRSLHSDSSRIIAVGGGIAFGGKAGAGTRRRAQPARHRRPADDHPRRDHDSTLTIGGTSLEVTAANVNPATDSRIFAFGAGIGLGGRHRRATSGSASCSSVNIIVNTTEAYIKSSRRDREGRHGRGAEHDGSRRPTTRASSPSQAPWASRPATRSARRSATTRSTTTSSPTSTTSTSRPTARSRSRRRPTARSAASPSASRSRSVADGKLAGAGSLLINKITNTVEAYDRRHRHRTASRVTGSAVISVGGADHADRDGRLADRLDRGRRRDRGPGRRGRRGDQLQPDLERDRGVDRGRDASTPGAAASDLASRPVLDGDARRDRARRRGHGGNFALGGSLTVNSIANTLDAHIDEQHETSSAGDDVLRHRDRVRHARRRRGRRRRQPGGTAVGAAIAYNFIGGSFDDANPDLINKRQHRDRPDHGVHRQRAGDRGRRHRGARRLRAADDAAADERQRLDRDRRPVSEHIQFVRRPSGRPARLHRAARFARLERHVAGCQARRSPSPSAGANNGTVRDRRDRRREDPAPRQAQRRLSTTESAGRRRS